MVGCIARLISPDPRPMSVGPGRPTRIAQNCVVPGSLSSRIIQDGLVLGRLCARSLSALLDHNSRVEGDGARVRRTGLDCSSCQEFAPSGGLSRSCFRAHLHLRPLPREDFTARPRPHDASGWPTGRPGPGSFAQRQRRLRDLVRLPEKCDDLCSAELASGRR